MFQRTDTSHERSPESAGECGNRTVAATSRRQLLRTVGTGLSGLGLASSLPATTFGTGITQENLRLAGQIDSIDGGGTQAIVELYTRDGDSVALQARTETDSTGQYDLRATITDQATVVAMADDWFTTRHVGSSTATDNFPLTLDHELLYGPRTATTDAGEAIGTVSLWRRVSPTDPTNQVLFVDITLPKSETKQTLKYLINASFSVILPEHVDVGYPEEPASGCRDVVRPPQCWRLVFEAQDPERVNAWHPTQGPQLPPFTLADRTYAAAFELTEQERRKWNQLSRYGFRALPGAIGQNFGNLADNSGDLLDLALTTIDVLDIIDTDQQPDATLGVSDVDERLSPNETDTITQTWTSPDIAGIAKSDLRNVTYQVPMQIHPDAAPSEEVPAVVYSRWQKDSQAGRLTGYANPGTKIGEYTDNITLDIPGRSSGGLGTQEDLVGYWPLEAVESGTVSDESGLGHDGTVSGAPQQISGAVGQALEFDGERDFVRVEMTPELQTTGSFTLELWANPTTDTNGTPLGLYSYNGNGSGEGMAIKVGRSNGDLQLNFNARHSSGYGVGGGSARDDPYYHIAGPGPRLAADAWQHIALQYDDQAETIALYLAGEEEYSMPAPKPPRVDDTYLTIGANVAPDGPGHVDDVAIDHFAGGVDEVLVYNRAVTDDTLRRHANRGV